MSRRGRADRSPENVPRPLDIVSPTFGARMRNPPHKSAAFWPLAALLVLADCGTKELAVEHLGTPHIPHEIVGTTLRFTLAYNPGAAFSMSVGSHSRWVFTLLAAIVLVVLLGLYRATPTRDAWQAAALALVAGGAIGNALDRLRSARGVVDFIDVGIGAHRFWTFNVADMGLTIGASLLALLLWRRDQARTAADARDVR